MPPTDAETTEVRPTRSGSPGSQRWLVRFGYDGLSFWGWARQPSRVTIEGTILRFLSRHPGSFPDGGGLTVASRTDRGVSAVANAMTVRTTLGSSTLLRALNGADPRLYFTAATPVAEGFRVRSALRRVYRYYEPAPPSLRGLWRRGAAIFTGTVDVRSFGRGLSSVAPIWRDIESVSIWDIDGGVCVELRARSFVWGMVRKIIGALREFVAGRVSLARLVSATKGTERLTLPLAEPDRLVLFEVQYPLGWISEWAGPNRHQARHLRSLRDSLWARTAMTQVLGAGAVGEGAQGEEALELIRPGGA